MSRIDDMRNRQLELRVRERELIEAIEQANAELQANRAEQERIKQQIITDAQTSMRLKSVSSPQAARAVIARLGGFTMSEAVAELGWERAKVKKLLDAMLCEKPPAVVPEGKVGKRPFFRYVGPEIEAEDPAAEREAAALEAVRDWAIDQQGVFSPGQCAAAVDLPRATVMRALRALTDAGMLVDEGPTVDKPLFRLASTQAPDVALDRPELSVVSESEPLSKIPAIQKMLEAAQQAGAKIDSSNGHFTIETLDGRRVHIRSKPNRQTLLEDRAKLRRVGITVIDS